MSVKNLMQHINNFEFDKCAIMTLKTGIVLPSSSEFHHIFVIYILQQEAKKSSPEKKEMI